MTVSVLSGEQGVPLLAQKYFGKTKKRHINEFGCVFGIIFSLIGIYHAFNNGMQTTYWMIGSTLLLLALSYLAPIVIYPLWSGWMTFAHYLGLIMSFLFVSITWVVMAVPLAIILRLIGKKVLDLRYGDDVDSYWEEREDKLHDFKLLERQF